MEEEREGGSAWTHTLCVTVSGYSLDTGECFKDRGRAWAIVPFKPPQPQSSLALFTCSQCRPRPCSVWRSTSWGGCFSGLYGRRKTVTTVTEDLRSCFLTEGIRGEVFPTQSRTLGSPSSRRVWPLACTSLQEKKKKDNNKLFKYIWKVWVHIFETHIRRALNTEALKFWTRFRIFAPPIIVILHLNDITEF